MAVGVRLVWLGVLVQDYAGTRLCVTNRIGEHSKLTLSYSVE